MDSLLPMALFCIAIIWSNHDSGKAFDLLTPEEKARLFESGQDHNKWQMIPSVALVLAFVAYYQFRPSGSFSIVPFVIFTILVVVWSGLSSVRCDRRLRAMNLPKAYLVRVRRGSWVVTLALMLLLSSTLYSTVGVIKRATAVMERGEKMVPR